MCDWLCIRLRTYYLDMGFALRQGETGICWGDFGLRIDGIYLL